MKAHWRLLVVEGEQVLCESLAAWLREDGYTVDTARSGREAIELAGQREYAIYFVDLKMPGGMDGIETMVQIRRTQPEASIIIITAHTTVDTAIAAIKEGAQEYIVKPCNPEEISLLIGRIIKVKNLQRENTILRQRLTRHYRFQDILSKNPRMQAIMELAHEVAGLSSPVSIQGDTGTGKELIARAIHFSGDRAAKPFVAVSCAGLAETLLEFELFGYEEGAFPGADQMKPGKFEQADGGTVFLDEIGDISSKLQADLLRVLQDRNFCRPGGPEEVHVDARVIAATQANLQQAAADGKFREDLFYRLNVIEIRIPPLRERREDIPLLAHHFVERFSHELSKGIGELSEGALKALMDYDWPGNVRELENAIERAMVASSGRELTETDFVFLAPNGACAKNWSAPAGMTLQEMEKRLIAATIQHTRGNIKGAASVLGIDRSTLYEKIKRYEIPR